MNAEVARQRITRTLQSDAQRAPRRGNPHGCTDSKNQSVGISRPTRASLARANTSLPTAANCKPKPTLLQKQLMVSSF
jgi:hypothetical protein